MILLGCTFLSDPKSYVQSAHVQSNIIRKCFDGLSFTTVFAGLAANDTILPFTIFSRGGDSGLEVSLPWKKPTANFRLVFNVSTATAYTASSTDDTTS